MPQDVQTAPGPARPQAAGPTQPADPTTEPFAHLHKMSTTAGVTNQDYVAVNPLAVVAALLGVASGLAFAGWLLLVIPIVGIVFAIVAIRQIADSNGTQTGRGLAIVGLTLCVLCAAGMMTRRYIAYAAVRNDTNAIASTLVDTGTLIGAADYRRAYDEQFDGQFKRNIPFDQFRQTWQNLQSHSYVGQLQTMRWNGVTPEFRSSGGAAEAFTKAKIKFEKGQEERFDVILKLEQGKWRINAMPQFFKPPQAGPQRGNPADDFQL